MGITFVEAEIANIAAPDVSESLEFFVDSGMLHSVVPELILAGLGIKPHGSVEFRMPNRRTVTRATGAAVFHFDGRSGGSDVVFGEPGDAALLGTLTLSSLGLSLHPLKRELNELPMLL